MGISLQDASADNAEGAGFAVVLGAFADLGDRIDKVGPAVASSLSRTAKPVIRPLQAAIVSTAADPDVIVLPQRPQAGRIWNLRRVGLFGADGHTAVAGAVVDVYTGNDEDNPDFAAQFITGSPIPSITTYGRDRIRVKSGEQVFALVYTVAAAQQLVLACEIEEFRVQDAEAMSI